MAFSWLCELSRVVLEVDASFYCVSFIRLLLLASSGYEMDRSRSKMMTHFKMLMQKYGAMFKPKVGKMDLLS